MYENFLEKYSKICKKLKAFKDSEKLSCYFDSIDSIEKEREYLCDLLFKSDFQIPRLNTLNEELCFEFEGTSL